MKQSANKKENDPGIQGKLLAASNMPKEESGIHPESDHTSNSKGNNPRCLLVTLFVSAFVTTAILIFVTQCLPSKDPLNLECTFSLGAASKQTFVIQGENLTCFQGDGSDAAVCIEPLDFKGDQQAYRAIFSKESGLERIVEVMIPRSLVGYWGLTIEDKRMEQSASYAMLIACNEDHTGIVYSATGVKISLSELTPEKIIESDGKHRFVRWEQSSDSFFFVYDPSKDSGVVLKVVISSNEEE